MNLKRIINADNQSICITNADGQGEVKTNYCKEGM